jgi:GNAT superfamily N-acetyltransferase
MGTQLLNSRRSGPRDKKNSKREHSKEGAMLEIRPMGFADIPFGMRLKEEAGWNQTEADWRRYLELQPDGCFMALLDGQPVGTVTTCIFGPVAWIAMVLVDGRYRRKGIGKALMQNALEFLDRHGVRTARLDATPLGQPLYEKLGFEIDYILHRHGGTFSPGGQPTGVEPMRPDYMESLLTLDQTVTGTDRRKLLVRLASEFPEATKVIRTSGGVAGFCSGRPGTKACQIGPCIAIESAAVPLLDAARHQYAGQPVFLDIPVDNHAAVHWAENAGLTIQRPLVRMHRGHSHVDRIESLWASSGPEMG